MRPADPGTPTATPIAWSCSRGRPRNDGVANDDAAVAQFSDARPDRQHPEILGRTTFDEIVCEQVAIDGHQHLSRPESGCLEEDVIVRVATSLRLSRERHDVGVARGDVVLPDPPGGATTCQEALDALAERFAAEEHG